MRHIKKRMLFEKPISEVRNTKFESVPFNQTSNVLEELKTIKGSTVYLTTDSDEVIAGFIENISGKYCIIPIPDLTLVYFNRAQLLSHHVKKDKGELLEKISLSEELTEDAINEIYTFYGSISGFVIFLFTAIESYINSMIPDDFKYELESSKRVEIYNKQQIEKYLSFDDKIKKVLPAIYKTSFFANPSSHTQIIYNLKDFRDNYTY